MIRFHPPASSRRQHTASGRIPTRLLACLLALACAVAAHPATAANCDSTSKGFTPLNDLGPGFYKTTYQGGLYPGGSNQRPQAHQQKGLAAALAMTPLDTLGNPDPVNGKIVLLSIGMCNTSQEYQTFTNLANSYAQKNPKVFLLNGAQGGNSAAVIANPNAPFWANIDVMLAQAGLSRKQVQAIWFKQANAGPTQAFPDHANILLDQFRTTMNILKSRYENSRICYLSSRIYAGYASTALNPEPYAYEGGFAVKWLIEEQINGSSQLNCDPNLGAVNSPWLSWGPYLWADGLVPRSDGLTWLCSDLANDGTHPSSGGRLKVGQLLLDFLTTDATATPWFLSSSSGAEAPPPVVRVGPALPNPFTGATTVQVIVTDRCPVSVDVLGVSGRRLRSLFDGTLDTGAWNFSWDGTDSNGQAVGAGVYFLQVRGEGEPVRSVKVALAR